MPEATVSASLVFGGAIHAAVEHQIRELPVGNLAPAPTALLEAYQAASRLRQIARVERGQHPLRQAV